MKLFAITTITTTILNLVTISASPITWHNLTTTNTTPLKWTGLNSKGINITLHGKAHEVISQLKSLDPNWIPHQPNDSSVVPTRRQFSSSYSYAVDCCPIPGQSFSPQNVTNVLAASQHLEELSGRFSLTEAPPRGVMGARGCYTLAVANGAAIVLCNDNDNSLADVSLHQISVYATVIVESCPINEKEEVCGQLFNEDGWNIIIDRESGLPYPSVPR